MNTGMSFPKESMLNAKIIKRNSTIKYVYDITDIVSLSSGKIRIAGDIICDKCGNKEDGWYDATKEDTIIILPQKY